MEPQPWRLPGPCLAPGGLLPSLARVLLLWRVRVLVSSRGGRGALRLGLQLALVLALGQEQQHMLVQAVLWQLLVLVMCLGGLRLVPWLLLVPATPGSLLRKRVTLLLRPQQLVAA